MLLKTTATILRFVFEGNSLRTKRNELLPVSATRLQMHMKHIHRLGKPFLIALETVAEKFRIPCSHAKKIRIRNLCFRKIHFRERFRKAPFWGPSVFKSSGYVRIRVTVSMYPGSKSSIFEKTRVRVHVAWECLWEHSRCLSSTCIVVGAATVTPAENFVSPLSESSLSPRKHLKKKKKVSVAARQSVHPSERSPTLLVLRDSAFDRLKMNSSGRSARYHSRWRSWR